MKKGRKTISICFIHLSVYNVFVLRSDILYYFCDIHIFSDCSGPGKVSRLPIDYSKISKEIRSGFLFSHIIGA